MTVLTQLRARVLRMQPRELVAISVVAMLILSAVCFFWQSHWTRDLWLPSLTCNLLTTALAIWVINRVVADADERRKGWAKRFRRHRKEMREMKRQTDRRNMMMPETGYPAAASLSLGADLIEVALGEDLPGVLEYMRKRQKSYFEHASAIGHFCLVFGRFLTFKELGAMENIRRSIKHLAGEVDIESTEDVRKSEIIRRMEELNVCVMQVGMEFSDQELLKLQGEFNTKMGTLRRKWDVPAIRKTLREEQAQSGAPRIAD